MIHLQPKFYLLLISMGFLALWIVVYFTLTEQTPAPKPPQEPRFLLQKTSAQWVLADQPLPSFTGTWPFPIPEEGLNLSRREVAYFFSAQISASGIRLDNQQLEALSKVKLDQALLFSERDLAWMKGAY